MATTPKSTRKEIKKGATLAKAQQKAKVGLPVTQKQKSVKKSAEKAAINSFNSDKAVKVGSRTTVKTDSKNVAASMAQTRGEEKVNSNPGQKVTKKAAVKVLNDGASARLYGAVRGGITKTSKGK